MKRIPVCSGCKQPRAECPTCGKGFLEMTQQGEVPEFILVEATDPKYPDPKSHTPKPGNSDKADAKKDEEAKGNDSESNPGQTVRQTRQSPEQSIKILGYLKTGVSQYYYYIIIIIIN